MKLTLQVLQAFSDALYVSPAVYSAGTFLRFQPNLIFVQLIQKTRQFYKFTYIAFKSKKRSSFLEQSQRKKWFAELLFRRTKNVYFYHFAHRSKMDPYGQVKTCFISFQIFDKTSNAFTSNWSIFNEFVTTRFTLNEKTLNWLFSWRCP